MSDGPPTVATDQGWGGAIFLGSSSLVGSGNPYVSSRGHLYARIGPRVKFIENSATRGAAIGSVSTSVLSIRSAEFVGNVALEGAAMFIRSDGDQQPRLLVNPRHYTEVSDTTFNANIASAGAALFLRVSLATAPLKRAGISPKNISRFTTDEQNNNEDDVFFERSLFTNNVAVQRGGAVFAEAGRVGFRGCIFDSNDVSETNDSGCGGAIALRKQAALHGRDLTLINNTAAFGGAVHAVNSLVDLIRANITSNTAFNDGGGLCIEIHATTIFQYDVVGRLANSSVRANKARNGGE